MARSGDILDEPCFAHIINSMCTRAHGLSQQVARKYPWADCYADRTGVRGRRNLADPDSRPKMGTCDIRVDKAESLEKIIVALIAQRDFGLPNFGRVGRTREPDTKLLRQRWFRMALTNAMDTLKVRGAKELALPYKVGCGLGGGDWDAYERIIHDVNNAIDGIDIVIVKKDD